MVTGLCCLRFHPAALLFHFFAAIGGVTLQDVTSS